MAFTGKKVSHVATPSFVALRAAILAVDDLARLAVRKWFDANTITISGQVKGDAAEPEGIAALVAAGYRILDPQEQRLWRHWLFRWTDYTGRIITPSEHEALEEKLRLEMDARMAKSRAPR